MVRITEDLIRRRAEHNNCEIFSLEEVSLHQQDIERIEYIDKWCKDLKILYLQNNLIPKIENVGRLKKLEYLNLALNNIEVIENLEGCESLQKLDLTVNFVGCLSSVESLSQNVHLRELYLVGNPCTEFQGYREYVVASLPQLQWLDGTAIGRAERIRALQDIDGLRRRVSEQEAEYVEKREKQKSEGPRENTLSKAQDLEHAHTCCNSPDSEEDAEIWKQGPHPEAHSKQNLDTDLNPDVKETLEEKEFWEKPCAFTPESRLEAHRHLEEKKRQKEKIREKKSKTKPPRVLITAEGRVLNVNEAKLDFILNENEDCVLLDLHVYRHLDTSLLDVDVQPTYVRVAVKGKVFQLVLPDEVNADSSTAQRSQTTGHLLLTMPKAHCEIKVKKSDVKLDAAPCSKVAEEDRVRTISGWERLEVDPSKGSAVDFANIVSKANTTSQGPLQLCRRVQPCGAQEKAVSTEFVDDPEVPPLI